MVDFYVDPAGNCRSNQDTQTKSQFPVNTGSERPRQDAALHTTLSIFVALFGIICIGGIIFSIDGIWKSYRWADSADVTATITEEEHSNAQWNDSGYFASTSPGHFERIYTAADKFGTKSVYQFEFNVGQKVHHGNFTQLHEGQPFIQSATQSRLGQPVEIQYARGNPDFNRLAVDARNEWQVIDWVKLLLISVSIPAVLVFGVGWYQRREHAPGG